ncbi:MAG: class I SAM-dependent methyltransferase [Bacteroides sp.]|nr:class I SAM-dependent methyltransferase [Eubacterium sp.]MCM1419221.1 class I SAM-dependent methyltransferase [Roseburia sp.]MCM1463459.1 class I SAM-dependent methyltransferase [Bacteroides sp.]
MEKITIDNGQSFDFGKTSKAYGKYRDIYPDELFTRLHEIGIGAKDSRWLDLGTGTGVLPRNMAKYGADIIATDISESQIDEAIALSAGIENIQYEVRSAEAIDYPEGTFDAITACQCFWYFDPNIIVPKIRYLIKPGGIFLKVYMSYIKEEPITYDSNNIVKKINDRWAGASPAIKDLKTHYFDDPHTDTFVADLPFTRETWHGRMMSSRGVMASMNEKQISQFDREHMLMLKEKYPEKFTVKHKIFLTWYYF